MKRFDAGRAEGRLRVFDIDDEVLPAGCWPAVIRSLTGGQGLRPIQRDALHVAKVLESRQNLIVSAPTNSGKTLIGHLILLDAVAHGRRAVLIEPLRALAQEKADELTEQLDAIVQGGFARAPKIRISTGDYRLDSEFPSAPPPEAGEIIIATPERLDAIMRNPANADWIATIGALVVDEAHLIGDPRRGPVLELLVASMLSLKMPPRIVLLSATIGSPELLRDWLRPCQVLISEERTPLTNEVWALEEAEHPDAVLEEQLRAPLAEPTNAIIVFVYRRDSAESLASKLSANLNVSVASYHSGQPAAQRARIRSDFVDGKCRVLVATTALALGVNLPATHVFVRDSNFYGFGSLSEQELLQIMGRAGRGDKAGFGAVLLRPTDHWGAYDLSARLTAGKLPKLQSSLDLNARRRGQCAEEVLKDRELTIASLVATCLSRSGDVGMDIDELSRFLSNTLGGRSIVSAIPRALRWLSDPNHTLAFKDESDRFRLTTLGKAGIKAVLPLRYLAGFGQLIRDLISLSPEGTLLQRWSPLDHLFVAALLSERTPALRRFSEPLAARIDGWMESRKVGEKSMLFNEWVTGTASATKADEIFGSLGLSTVPAASARKKAYVAMLSALILDERSRGVPLSDIERRWGLTDLDGADESWRDAVIWLVSGHAAICEVRAFYHHMRESCSVTETQVRDAKRAFAHMRREVYDLLDTLKYCSPLGPLMRGAREMRRGAEEPTLGVGTIRKLEAAGVSTLAEVAAMDLQSIVAAGVQHRFAKQILAYLRRRLR